MAVISNHESDAHVTGTKSSDNISNTGSNVIIEAFGGNDSIKNETVFEKHGELISSPDEVSISAGLGNDYIDNEGATR